MNLDIICKKFVESRVNFHDLGDGFNPLIAHALFCTIKDEVVCAKEYGNIRFGSLDEVIKVNRLEWLDVSKGVPKGVARPVEHSGSVEPMSCCLPVPSDLSHEQASWERSTRAKHNTRE